MSVSSIQSTGERVVTVKPFPIGYVPLARRIVDMAFEDLSSVMTDLTPIKWIYAVCEGAPLSGDLRLELRKRLCTHLGRIQREAMNTHDEWVCDSLAMKSVSHHWCFWCQEYGAYGVPIGK